MYTRDGNIPLTSRTPASSDARPPPRKDRGGADQATEARGRHRQASEGLQRPRRATDAVARPDWWRGFTYAPRGPVSKLAPARGIRSVPGCGPAAVYPSGTTRTATADPTPLSQQVAASWEAAGQSMPTARRRAMPGIATSASRRSAVPGTERGHHGARPHSRSGSGARVRGRGGGRGQECAALHGFLLP